MKEIKPEHRLRVCEIALENLKETEYPVKPATLEPEGICEYILDALDEFANDEEFYYYMQFCAKDIFKHDFIKPFINKHRTIFGNSYAFHNTPEGKLKRIACLEEIIENLKK